MRLLYVGGLDSAQKGAVGTHTLGVLRALRASGVDLHGLFLSDQVPDGYDGPITLVPASAVKGVYKKVFDRYLIAKAARRLGSSYDYVYARYDPLLSRQMISSKLILEYNDDFLTQIDFAAAAGHFSRSGAALRRSKPYRRLIQSIERRCFAGAHVVVCVTQRLCDIVLRRAPTSRTFCMLNASDAVYDPVLDPRYDDDVLRIGHIGTLTYWDGLAELVRGTARFVERHPDRRVKLLVLGDGKMKAELVALAEQLGLADAVDFQGSVSRSEALKALHRVDVVPLLKTLSHYDLSPIKFYEGLCTGRFLLTSDIPHINNLLEDEGIVVGFPLDVDEIAEAIAALHHRLPEIRRNVEARSRSAQARHSWMGRVQSLLDLLGAPAHAAAQDSATGTASSAQAMAGFAERDPVPPVTRRTTNRRLEVGIDQNWRRT